MMTMMIMTLDRITRPATETLAVQSTDLQIFGGSQANGGGGDDVLMRRVHAIDKI